MAIDLNILQKTNPKASPDNPRPQERVGEDFLFRDVRLDLEKGKCLFLGQEVGLETLSTGHFGLPLC